MYKLAKGHQNLLGRTTGKWGSRKSALMNICILVTVLTHVYYYLYYVNTSGAMTLLCKSANCVAEHCFGKTLIPGATCSDHGAGCRNGLLAVWPDVPHAQCWPHIIRKYGEGTLPGSAKGESLSKKHPHYEEVGVHLRAVHMCQSEGMMDVLIGLIATVRIHLQYIYLIHFNILTIHY